MRTRCVVFRQGEDGLEQFGVLAVFDDQAPRAGAALAGGKKGGLDDDHRRRLDVLGIPHDDWRVAAQFERQDLVRRFGELAMQRVARPRRSREQQPVDTRLGG